MTIAPLFPSADRHYEGDPPSDAEIDQDHSVEFVIGLLEQAGRGASVAWALDAAMCAVANPRFACAAPIPPPQRDQLLEAAIRAELSAEAEFGDELGYDVIRRGMQGLAFQIIHWADPRDPNAIRATRSHAQLDAHGHARILRNVLHNVDIRKQMDERAAERSASAAAARTRS